MHNTLIHIGLHKTGTTWLQNELFINGNSSFEPLSNNTRPKGYSSLAMDFVLDHNASLLNSFDSNEMVIKHNLDIILKQKKIENKVLVMSHERLSGYPSSAGFDGSIIMRRIKNVFPSAKILIMIREQKSLLLSNYFQYLKEGGVRNIDKYLNSKYDARVPNLSENYFHFHYMISEYQNLFGKENVLVMPYEIFNLEKDVFINQLSLFLKKDIHIAAEKFSIKHNTKSHQFVNYHFRWLNYFIYSSSSLNSANALKYPLIKTFALKFKNLMFQFSSQKMDKKTKQNLQYKVEKWSYGKFAESNRITSDLIGVDLSTLGYSV
ncbi:MAG: sulfotransferase domain-containing protein [Aquaticitalea sp.]